MKKNLKEDMSIINDELVDVLKKNGYRVAIDGEYSLTATKLYNEAHEDFSSIEINAHGVNEIKVRKNIKIIEREDIIIMISGDGKALKVMEAIKSGTLSFIAKPFRERDVLKLLNKMPSSYEVVLND